MLYVTELHSEVCRYSVVLLTEGLFPIRTIWFGNDTSAFFDKICYSDFSVCVRLQGTGY